MNILHTGSKPGWICSDGCDWLIQVTNSDHRLLSGLAGKTGVEEPWSDVVATRCSSVCGEPRARVVFAEGVVALLASI